MVKNLDNLDISNDDKRRNAFNQIKSEAVSAGKNLRTSLVNLAIEVAVNLVREQAK